MPATQQPHETLPPGSGHVTVLRDHSGAFRWIEIIRPTTPESGDPLHEMKAEIRRDLEQEGICVSDRLLERIVRDEHNADIHHCDHQYLSFSFHALRSESNADEQLTLSRHKIELLVGQEYLVTIWEQRISDSFTLLRHLWQHEDSPHSDGAMAFLFTQILKQIIAEYHDVLDDIPEKLFALERAVGSSDYQHIMQQAPAGIFQFNRALLEIRRYFGPLRRALDRICELAQEDRSELQPFSMKYSWIELYDLRTQVEHLIELVDTYRDTVTNVFGAYQSTVSNSLAEISNNMNKVMQRLTIIATILTTASVITGFYGMNLAGMGIGTSYRYSALILCCCILAIGLFEYWLFKRKKWL